MAVVVDQPASVGAAAAQDPASAEARDAFWFDRFNKAKVVFDRAVERGEIPTDVDPILAYGALIGPCTSDSSPAPLHEGLLDEYVDPVLDGVTVPNCRGVRARSYAMPGCASGPLHLTVATKSNTDGSHECPQPSR